MTIQKRLLALLLALALGFSLAACTNEDADGSEEPSGAASEAVTDPGTDEVDLTQDILSYAAGLSGDETLLTVNGQEIPADLFLYYLSFNCAYFEYSYGLYGYTVETYADSLLDGAVSMAAYYVLMEQMSQQYGCLLTDEQQTKVEEKMYADGTEAYEQVKALYGLDDDAMKFIHAAEYYYSNLLEALVSDPTEDDLNQYIADAGIFSVKHILLKTTTEDIKDDDGNVTQTADEHNAAQKALAEDLLAQINAADDLGTTFDALMNEYSEDGRDSDGNLGAPDGYTFNASDSLVDGFREASLALEPGQVSGIVETSFGYHIILRLEVEDLDSYSDACREYQLDELVTQWLDEADIVRADALTDLDVSTFYRRYTAYQTAFQAQNTDSDPETSGTTDNAG